MANPQKENGHTQIANEILEVLAMTKLTTQESRVLFAILRKTYGFNKKEDWIANSELERMTGIHRAHCANTVTRLKDRRIVTKTGNKIQFNKDYSQWLVLPKRVTKKVLPKQVQGVTQTGNQLVPKQVYTKDTITKDNIQKTIYVKKEKLSQLFKHDFELIQLTGKEMGKLADKFGSDLRDHLVDFENALGAKGYKYKSHYRAMLKWYDKPKNSEFYINEIKEFGPHAFIHKYGVELANKYINKT